MKKITTITYCDVCSKEFSDTRDISLVHHYVNYSITASNSYSSATKEYIDICSECNQSILNFLLQFKKERNHHYD